MYIPTIIKNEKSLPQVYLKTEFISRKYFHLY